MPASLLISYSYRFESNVELSDRRHVLVWRDSISGRGKRFAGFPVPANLRPDGAVIIVSQVAHFLATLRKVLYR